MGLFDGMFGGGKEQNSAAPAVDDEWQKLVDESSGTPYYWNTVTGETSWEEPVRESNAAAAAAEGGQGGLFDFLKPQEVDGDSRALVNRYRDVAQGAAQPTDLPFPIELMQDTFLEGRTLARVYKASTDGWGAVNFHTKCDLKGPCVVYAETEDGWRFGAFNPEGWQSDDDYKNNLNAFLFCWPDPEGEPCKLAKVGGGEAALFDYARSGPHFGADGLIIGPGQAAVTGLFAGPDTNDVTTSQGQLRVATSRLGQSYAKLPGGGTSVLGEGRESAQLREVEVWAAPELF